MTRAAAASGPGAPPDGPGQRDPGGGAGGSSDGVALQGMLGMEGASPAPASFAMPPPARILVSAALSVAVLGSFGPALAQGLPDDCRAPTSQAALNDCAADAFAEADAALNAAWDPARDWARRMDERARREEARGTWIGPPGFAGTGEERSLSGALLDAQRGWLRYRDGHCAAQSAPFSGGSMWPMLHAGCRAALTRDRTDELRALVPTPDGSEGSAAGDAAVGDETGGLAPGRSEVSCLFAGEAEAVPCTMEIARVGPEAQVAWTAADGRAVRFRGSWGDGWWFGMLDGAEAAGRELNRGHVAFSSRDRATTFRYWSSGSEHGTY